MYAQLNNFLSLLNKPNHSAVMLNNYEPLGVINSAGSVDNLNDKICAIINSEEDVKDAAIYDVRSHKGGYELFLECTVSDIWAPTLTNTRVYSLYITTIF